MAALASYLSHLEMANSYGLRQKLLARFGWLEQFFAWQGGKLKRFDQAAGWILPKGQDRFFLRKCSGSILFMQVGRFYELYDRQAAVALHVLGLRGIGARRDFRTRCGFPCRLKEIYARMLMSLGLPVCVVNEEDSWISGVKKGALQKDGFPCNSDLRNTWASLGNGDTSGASSSCFPSHVAKALARRVLIPVPVFPLFGLEAPLHINI